MQEQIISPSRSYSWIYEFVEAYMTAIVCVVLVFTFAARMVGVVGVSMYPTLQDGDRLIITPLYGELQNGDLVVVVKPTSLGEPLIKRVIAMGGQVVDIDFATGDVLVDGVRLDEPYIAEKIAQPQRDGAEFPQRVPEGCLFLLGDNRNHSWDSRVQEVGMVDERYVMGKVIVRVMPFDRRNTFI